MPERHDQPAASRSESGIRSVLRVPPSGFAATCPDCGDIAHPSVTVCEGCGAHLFVRQGSGRPFTAKHAHDSDCPCLSCYFAEVDGDA